MDFLKKIIKKVFQYEARIILKKYKPKIIAIVGSVGKTSTREALYTVLSRKFFVRKSEKSFTAELGIPMTIMGCPVVTGSVFQLTRNFFLGLRLIFFKKPYPQLLILEVDADKPGDLETVSSYLSPDILIMVAIGEVPTHIEAFNKIENLILEEKEIIKKVKVSGVIIYNADDVVTKNLLANSTLRKVSCGVGKGILDIKGSGSLIKYSNKMPTGFSFYISYTNEKYKLDIPNVLGVPVEYASLLAFATGIELGIDPKEIIVSLNKLTTLSGRMRIIEGLKETIIIDDSYNSSPVAISQALEVLSKLKVKGKKIAVLGDMLELGKYSADEHKKIAPLLYGKVSSVIFVGIRARKISEELIALGFNKKNIISVDTSEEAGGELQELLKSGDVALVKGSQAMRMEKVVEEVMRHPEQKKRILVRQGEEWKGR